MCYLTKANIITKTCSINEISRRLTDIINPLMGHFREPWSAINVFCEMLFTVYHPREPWKYISSWCVISCICSSWYVMIDSLFLKTNVIFCHIMSYSRFSLNYKTSIGKTYRDHTLSPVSYKANIWQQTLLTTLCFVFLFFINVLESCPQWSMVSDNQWCLSTVLTVIY